MSSTSTTEEFAANVELGGYGV